MLHFRQERTFTQRCPSSPNLLHPQSDLPGERGAAGSSKHHSWTVTIKQRCWEQTSPPSLGFAEVMVGGLSICFLLGLCSLASSFSELQQREREKSVQGNMLYARLCFQHQQEMLGAGSEICTEPKPSSAVGRFSSKATVLPFPEHCVQGKEGRVWNLK